MSYSIETVGICPHPTFYFICQTAKIRSPIDHVGVLVEERYIPPEYLSSSKPKWNIERDPYWVLEANHKVTLRPLSQRLNSKLNQEIYVRKLKPSNENTVNNTKHMPDKLVEAFKSLSYKKHIVHFMPSIISTPEKIFLNELYALHHQLSEAVKQSDNLVDCKLINIEESIQKWQDTLLLFINSRDTAHSIDGFNSISYQN